MGEEGRTNCSSFVLAVCACIYLYIKCMCIQECMCVHAFIDCIHYVHMCKSDRVSRYAVRCSGPSKHSAPNMTDMFTSVLSLWQHGCRYNCTLSKG